MRKMILASLAATAVFVVGATLAPAQDNEPEEKQGDPRVAALLDRAELKYKVDKDGDFKIILPTGDDRSQLVFIFTRTSTYREIEVREVWSVGYLSEGTMPFSVAKNLLRENSIVKLGGWELGKFSGREAGVFRIKIAADLDDEERLISVLRAVSMTADEKEKELLGSDDL